MSRVRNVTAAVALVSSATAGVTCAAARRLARTNASLRASHAEALARVPTPQQAARQALIGLLAGRSAVPVKPIATPITDLVHARLAPGDIPAVEAGLDEVLGQLYSGADTATRRRIAINFAAANGLHEVLPRMRVVAAVPPEDVHAMGRGPVAAGGDFYLADLMFDAMAHASFEVPEGGTILDFGSSSGRVLRAVAAGRDDLTCLGCDPNTEAIAWAQQHLPMADFFVSPQRPPLALADASVDAVYAVSIWSHFAERPALEWLAEMHRILAPGGALVLTTHGIDCLVTQLGRKQISEETAAAAAAAMLQGRHHFVDVFGPDGDWGVKDSGWGNAYFTLDWLAAQLEGAWSVELNWLGALDQVQDVLVLRRR